MRQTGERGNRVEMYGEKNEREEYNRQARCDAEKNVLVIVGESAEEPTRREKRGGGGAGEALSLGKVMRL